MLYSTNALILSNRLLRLIKKEIKMKYGVKVADLQADKVSSLLTGYTFDKPKGQRLHKRFIWITNFDGLWWSYKHRQWYQDTPPSGDYSTCCRCRSLKAFKRHLRKHPEIRGKAILVSRFIGYNVYA